MKRALLEILCCPICHTDLGLEIMEIDANEIISGSLKCNKCNKAFPIRNSIPRFTVYNYYADSFGLEWNSFVKTQLDNNNRVKESELRFRTELGWNEKDLKDKVVIEFGSGAGRFVDIVSKCGAKLAVGLDATDAVDASWKNLSNRNNVAFVQADIFAPPFKMEVFDYAYSIGVLHHTPDPQKGFNNMIDLTKTNGEVGVSLYERTLYKRPSLSSLKVQTKELFWALNLWRCEFFRVFTTRMPKKVFLAYCKTIIPVLHYLNKVPVFRYIRYLVPSTCYKSLPVEWSILDTFDTYATKIVNLYDHKVVFHWFLKEGMDHIIVHNSRTGWVSLTGQKPTGSEREKNKIIEIEPAPL